MTTFSQSRIQPTKIKRIFNCWKQLKAQRQYLRSFKPYLLNDIGFSQQQALATAKNPFWH